MARNSGDSSMGSSDLIGVLTMAFVFLAALIMFMQAWVQHTALTVHSTAPTQTIPADCEQAQILKDDLGGTYAICIQRVLEHPHDKLQITVLRPSNDTLSGWKADGFTFYPLPE